LLQKIENMKAKSSIALTFAATLVLLSSCSMEKRVYMPGYHVEWKGAKSAAANESAAATESAAAIQSEAVAQQEAGFQVAAEASENPVAGSADFAAYGDEVWADAGEETPESQPVTVASEMEAEAEEPAATWALEWQEGTGAILAEVQDVRVNGMAVAGFVMGLVGLLIFGLLFGILAIIFSAIGLGKINKDPKRWRGKGLAVAGLVLGILDIVLLAVLVAALV
jgi:hypothetical protein